MTQHIVQTSPAGFSWQELAHYAQLMEKGKLDFIHQNSFSNGII